MTQNTPAPADLVEAVARTLCRFFHARKSWYGACSKDERLNWLVNSYWQHWIPDAHAAIAAYQAHMASDGVVQGDRDAAFDIYGKEQPDNEMLVQAFARRRRAAATTPQPKNQALVDGRNADDLPMNEDQIKHMVDRFLGWKLPAKFQPDNGVSFNRVVNGGTEHQYYREPMGTNLFDAVQATEMVQFMVEGLSTPQPDPRDAVIGRLREALVHIMLGEYIFGSPQNIDTIQEFARIAIANSEGK